MSRRSRSRAEEVYGFAPVVRQYEELWSELCDISQRVGPKADGGSYDKPAYFECFGGHASCVLDESSFLYLTRLGAHATARELAEYILPQVRDAKIIDLALIHRAMAELKGVCRPVEAVIDTGTTLGALVANLVESEGRHPDYVRRNVMWLIKNGFVSPSRCDEDTD